MYVETRISNEPGVDIYTAFIMFIHKIESEKFCNKMYI